MVVPVLIPAPTAAPISTGAAAPPVATTARVIAAVAATPIATFFQSTFWINSFVSLAIRADVVQTNFLASSEEHNRYRVI